MVLALGCSALSHCSGEVLDADGWVGDDRSAVRAELLSYLSESAPDLMEISEDNVVEMDVVDIDSDREVVWDSDSSTMTTCNGVIAFGKQQ